MTTVSQDFEISRAKGASVAAFDADARGQAPGPAFSALQSGYRAAVRAGPSLDGVRGHLGPKFYSPFALTLILQQVAITGIVAMAETLIILTAGIDLSVAAIMVLTSVVMGRVAMIDGLPTFLPHRGFGAVASAAGSTARW